MPKTAATKKTVKKASRKEETVDALRPVEPEAFYFSVTAHMQELTASINKRLRVIYPNKTSCRAEQHGAEVIVLKFLTPELAEAAKHRISAFAKVKRDLIKPPFEDYLARQKSIQRRARANKDPLYETNSNALSLPFHAATEEQRQQLRSLLGEQSVISWASSKDRLGIFLDDYLPLSFVELLDDLAATKYNVHQVSKKLMSLAAAFVTAFRGLTILRMETIEPLTNAQDEIYKAHVELVDLLTLINEQKTQDELARITITRGHDNRVVVALNDEQFDPKESKGRTLITLALLRHQNAFSVDEFADYYFGEATVTNDSRLDNCLRGLDALKDRIKPDGTVAGLRRLYRTVFEVSVDDTELKRHLWEHYADAVKKKRPRP
jgi:hypothetical protein